MMAVVKRWYRNRKNGKLFTIVLLAIHIASLFFLCIQRAVLMRCAHFINCIYELNPEPLHESFAKLLNCRGSVRVLESTIKKCAHTFVLIVYSFPPRMPLYRYNGKQIHEVTIYIQRSGLIEDSLYACALNLYIPGKKDTCRF